MDSHAKQAGIIYSVTPPSDPLAYAVGWMLVPEGVAVDPEALFEATKNELWSIADDSDVGRILGDYSEWDLSILEVIPEPGSESSLDSALEFWLDRETPNVEPFAYICGGCKSLVLAGREMTHTEDPWHKDYVWVTGGYE